MNQNQNYISKKAFLKDDTDFAGSHLRVQSLGGYEVFWQWLQHCLESVSITSAMLDSGLFSHFSSQVCSTSLLYDVEHRHSCHDIIPLIPILIKVCPLTGSPEQFQILGLKSYLSAHFGHCWSYILAPLLHFGLPPWTLTLFWQASVLTCWRVVSTLEMCKHGLYKSLLHKHY